MTFLIAARVMDMVITGLDESKSLQILSKESTEISKALMENTKTFLFRIDETSADMRLDKALSQHPLVGSRSQATRLIDTGFVKHNGKSIKPSLVTQIDQEFEVNLPEDKSSKLQPLEISLDISYEDDDLIVINKPAGLVVHPAYGHEQDTLVNALIHHTKELSSGFESGRPGIVHRLDKDTSGLLVVAKNDQTHRALAKQFKNKSVHRVYWALCYGHFKKSSGRYESYLKRHPVDRKRVASSSDGKLAITNYRVIKELNGPLSLLELKLETGRTHQIRVHLSEDQHPIVGDPVYCSSSRVKSIKGVSNINIIKEAPHLMLHAAELGFFHPNKKENLNFHCPWPEELHKILKHFGAI